MRKRWVMIVPAASVLLTLMLPSQSSAQSDQQAERIEACRNGGWRDLVRKNGTAFENKRQCIRYVGRGRIPQPAEPTIEPAEPTIEPAEPTIEPAEPTIEPAEPTIEPAEPKEVTIAVAYTNLDGNPGYGSGDQLIARLVDDNGRVGLNPGDHVYLGKYPTSFSPPYRFESWGVSSHTVTGSVTTATELRVTSDAGTHVFGRAPGLYEGYYELLPSNVVTGIQDGHGSSWLQDYIYQSSSSPSEPPDDLLLTRPEKGSYDPFIDVDIY